MSSNKQYGFTVVEVLLIIVTLAVIGFAGFKVYDARKSVDDSSKSQATDQTATSQSAVSSDQAPAVNSTADLDKADQALDAINPNDNDSDDSQLDSQLATF